MSYLLFQTLSFLITVRKKSLAVKNFGEFGKSVKICQNFFHQPSRLSRRHFYSMLAHCNESALIRLTQTFICQHSNCGIRQSFYRQVLQ